MSGVNGYPFFMGGYTQFGPHQSSESLNAANDAFSNIVADGGPGIMPEHFSVGGASIPIPFANTINSAAARLGRNALGFGNTNPAMFYAMGGGGYMGGMGGAGTSTFAATGGAPGFMGPPGTQSFNATVPSPNMYFGAGGFGGQSSAILGIVGPKLNLKEQALAGLRTKIAAGDELSQTEMLQYQDLMQQQNQLFMFAQNCFTSEHEKIKGWSQALGRI